MLLPIMNGSVRQQPARAQRSPQLPGPFPNAQLLTPYRLLSHPSSTLPCSLLCTSLHLILIRPSTRNSLQRCSAHPWRFQDQENAAPSNCNLAHASFLLRYAHNITDPQLPLLLQQPASSSSCASSSSTWLEPPLPQHPPPAPPPPPPPRLLRLPPLPPRPPHQGPQQQRPRSRAPWLAKQQRRRRKQPAPPPPPSAPPLKQPWQPLPEAETLRLLLQQQQRMEPLSAVVP